MLIRELLCLFMSTHAWRVASVLKNCKKTAPYSHLNAQPAVLMRLRKNCLHLPQRVALHLQPDVSVVAEGPNNARLAFYEYRMWAAWMSDAEQYYTTPGYGVTKPWLKQLHALPSGLALCFLQTVMNFDCWAGLFPLQHAPRLHGVKPLSLLESDAWNLCWNTAFSFPLHFSSAWHRFTLSRIL